MTRHTCRIACLSLSTTFLTVGGCGNAGGTTDSFGDTSATVTVTAPSTSGATDVSTTAEPPTGGISDSDGQTTNIPTGGPTTDGSTTTGTGDTSGTRGDTTAGPCLDGTPCAGDCCGAGELCDNGECVPDCGGPPPCGEAKVCCAGGDLCYLGECVTPGEPCSEQVCATRPESAACSDGYQCNTMLGLCLPSKADLGCEFVPPPQTFAPRPRFTWGKRAQFDCTQDDECQIAEVCTDSVCTPTWPHITPGAGDKPNIVQSSSLPLVIDLDGDCVPEIVFNTYPDKDFEANGRLRAIRGDTGAKVWTVLDEAYDTYGTASPAAGDIDGDGTPEILIEGEDQVLLAFNSDGSPRWKSTPYVGVANASAPSIANMDGVGNPEIVIGSTIFDNTGKLLFAGPAQNGTGVNVQGPLSCVADLDGDMRPEVIAGKTAYKTTGTVAGNDFAGQLLWTAATADGFCGIADFDMNGKPEVVLVAAGTLYVLNGQTGATIAKLAVPSAERGGPPNIADFDGDGRRDIGVAGAYTYNVFLFKANNTLEVLWTADTEDDSSQVTGSSVFDFDGDGRYEVVYNDERYIRIYPGTEPACAKNPPGPACNKKMTDGEVLFIDRNSSRTRTEYPVIADVDGNFKADIVFPTNNDGPENFTSPIDAGLEVWRDSLDNWVGTRPIWNQHTYHITNVGLRGEIPVVEADSWTTPMGAPYNNYRNNTQGVNSRCAPDLVPADLDFDPETCETGVALSVFVANKGCLGVGPGVEVAFYDAQDTLLGVVQTTGPLQAGASEKVILVLPGVTGEQTVRAVIDDAGMGTGALNECVEDNNSTPPSPVCIPPG